MEQIRRYVFTGNAWSTITNRITKLEQGHLVKRLRVANLIHPLIFTNVGTVLKITSLGIGTLANKFASQTFSEISDIRVQQLQHDLLLLDVVEGLKAKHPKNDFVEGSRYVKGSPDHTRVPDFVMIDPESKEVTAIELELTAKSERRYRHVILDYRMSKSFSRVLFVTASETIKRKIMAEVLGEKVHDYKVQNVGKFFFLLVSDITRPTDPRDSCKLSNTSSIAA
ncbi:MAG: hypothetical protein R3A80_11190 [Bdellovibrionota bacterium]